MATKKKSNTAGSKAKNSNEQKKVSISIKDMERKRAEFPVSVWFDTVEIMQREDGISTLVFYAVDMHAKKMVEVNRLQTTGVQLKALEHIIKNMSE